MPNNFGIQLGNQLGKAMAMPLDFTPLTNYLLQQRERQKQMKMKIMQDVGADLASYNPDGILQKDIPDFYKYYNNWKNLAVNNIDVFQNPQKDFDTYQNIMSAKQQFLTAFAKMKEANTTKGMLDKFIMEQGLKNHKLTDNASDYWDHIRKTPTMELQHPIDLDEIVFNPDPKDVMEEAQKQMKIGTHHEDITLPSGDPKTLNQWSIPNYESINTASNMVWSNNADLQHLYKDKFAAMSDEDKEDLRKRIADTYKNIPSQYLGGDTNKSDLSDFDIASAEDLWKAHNIIMNAPQLIKTGIPNQTYFKEQSDKMQLKRMNISDRHYYESLNARVKNEIAIRANQIYKNSIDGLQDALDKEYDRKLYEYKQKIKYGESATPPEIKPIPKEVREKYRADAMQQAIELYKGKSANRKSNNKKPSFF